MLEFNVGDKAVYPAHGVAQITAIENKSIGGKNIKCYVLKIMHNGMIIMVPSCNVEKVGMRGVVKDKDVRKVFKILRNRDIEIDNQNWNRRYREYMEKIKSGSLLEIAEVMRDLLILKDDKELSFSERRMLDNARELLVKEISIAKDRSEDKVEKEFDSIFNC